MSKFIRVIPRLEKDGTPILFFPQDKRDRQTGFIGCYAHVGQHSQAHIDYYHQNTKPAKNGECDALIKEYDSIPPCSPIKIVKRNVLK